jgi:hypothetical protein
MLADLDLHCLPTRKGIHMEERVKNVIHSYILYTGYMQTVSKYSCILTLSSIYIHIFTHLRPV